VRVKCGELNLPLRKRFELYDAALMERIKLMARCNYNSTAIAKAVQRSPQSLRAKCSQLGIAFRQHASCARWGTRPIRAIDEQTGRRNR
jgi:hypothetical protein